VWDEEFVAAAEAFDSLRVRGVGRIAAALAKLTSVFGDLDDVALTYMNGLPREKSLREALEADRSSERLVGYTRVGPQRADFVVGRAGKGIGLSRGQQKAIVCLLQLACGAVQEAAQGVRSLWLLDDLWGDLDWDCASRLVAMILSGDRQCMFTLIGGHAGQVPGLLSPDTRLFHVEQGRVAVVSR
jgi:DNA replication and repair protein RecF